MTLDEAIIKALQKAKDCETESEKDYAQLAHWLQSYKDMLKDAGTAPQITLYEANRMLYSQLTPLYLKDVMKHKLDFLTFFAEYKYSMLMCKELSYYTCFNVKNPKIATQKLFDLLFESIQGDILEIEKNDDGNIEIWFKMKEDNEAHMFLLFPYDWGVIEC